MSLATVKMIVEVVFMIVCIVLNVIVLMQEGKNPGLGTIGGTSSNLDSYWSHNKGRSMEGRMVKTTRILTIVFLAVSALLNIGSFS